MPRFAGTILRRRYRNSARQDQKDSSSLGTCADRRWFSHRDPPITTYRINDLKTARTGSSGIFVTLPAANDRLDSYWLAALVAQVVLVPVLRR
jgi:hypothetical protein